MNVRAIKELLQRRVPSAVWAVITIVVAAAYIIDPSVQYAVNNYIIFDLGIFLCPLFFIWLALKVVAATRESNSATEDESDPQQEP